MGGGITGMGGHIVIVDDPFKDRASADSPTIRQNVWDWYTSTLYTRLAPGGGILVINTRWHMADLSGRLLEAAARGEGDHWRVVNFPAIATEDEPHRKAGEALHPERYPLEQLPGAPHDDQVDATTQALRDFDTKRPMSINPAIIQPRMSLRKIGGI